MVGSSGVDMRKGTDADDCGYGRRSSLYSNGGRRRDGRVAPEEPPRQPRIINVGGRRTDGRHLCRLKAEQSHAPGIRAGGAYRFGRKEHAGEGGGFGGPRQSDSCLAAGRSSSLTCWLANYLAELSDDNQTMDVASDQEPAPLSKPVHAVFTIEQVQLHFDTLMAEELPLQEDLCCNLRLLNEHR